MVLLLLVGGLVDIGRAIYITEGLSNAVREGARHAVWFDAPRRTNPYLNDTQIKAAVDAQLTASSMPASILRNPGTTCPAVADANGHYNPPYSSSSYPATVNQPWLYICYDNTPGTDFVVSPSAHAGNDVNIILLYTYAPLTPLLVGQFGTFRLATNEHMTVQGQ